MESFYITAETAHELIGNHGFQFTLSERKFPAFIDKKYIAPVFQVFIKRKRISSFIISEVPFIELNTDQVLELMVLPTADSRHVLIDSNWNQFADVMHSAKLLHEAMCFAH
ncbi:hypothetical protein VBApiPXC38_68 [Acinetobacter phage VB_ApiP_XC38]|uniref:Uncharacterized protein n=1 Tax=Acinetobacter phage VB_ApiP_XC38 TaxID=2655002 RepID=A0A5P8PR74_9CAUD|nr:hypothetical protein KNU81_gp68 [Acinetobacter phage VB_ApiP_XC38]QFR59755.1 hypothetical protein VBApiPXC38_68 [Acinetobacter phage VB_ApiP_XC38]